jgi:hypothetical protein
MKLPSKLFLFPLFLISSWNAKLFFYQKTILFWLLIFVVKTSVGQTNLGFEYNGSIPVFHNSNLLENPWAGGINYAQFSDLDIDYDGDRDLVAFDRSGDQFQVFVQIGPANAPSYRYLFNSATLFPSDCHYRCTFVDYDGDGQHDLFTYGLGGIKVYRNSGNASVGLQWTLIKSVLYTNYLGSYTNLYVSSSDIPAIVDVEGDGDLDILTFQIGGERVEYHQNQSMELYGNADSLIFELKNECWGQFREDPNNNAVILNDTQSPCGIGNIPNPQFGPDSTIGKKTPAISAQKHSGSTLLALDMNNNGVLDLLLGDVSYPSITLLMNGGTQPNTNSAFISQNNQFPAGTTAASMQLFPASFYVDVSFDGVKDLLVTPNARTVSENQHSVQFFLNTGTNHQPQFQYQQNDFLQNDMIDHGLGSIPIIFDQNGDGINDLLIGNFFRYKPVLAKESCFQLFQNSGTLTAPVFNFADDDYLQLTNQSFGFKSHPAIADLDNDGDVDLVIGLENGTLISYTNTAGASAPCNFANPIVLTDQSGTVISVQDYAAPQLFDLNKDGLVDLIIGKKSGELVYYENSGTTSNAIFSLKNAHLGNVDIASTPDGYAAPHFFSINDTTHLFVGAYDGQLHYYNQIDNQLDTASSFHLVSHSFLNIDVGLYSTFWTNDIDNDGLLDLFIGQDLGGISHLEVNPNSSASLQNEVPKSSLYVAPNPAQTFIQLKNEELTHFSTVCAVNLLGQVFPLEPSENNSLNIQLLAPGSYILHLIGTTSTEMIPFVKF